MDILFYIGCILAFLISPLVLVIVGSMIFFIVNVIIHAIIFGWALLFALAGSERAQKYVQKTFDF